MQSRCDGSKQLSNNGRTEAPTTCLYISWTNDMTASCLSASRFHARPLTHPLRLPLPYSASLTQMPYEGTADGTRHGGTWGGTDSFGPEQPQGRMAKKTKSNDRVLARIFRFLSPLLGTVEARRSRLGPTDTAVCDSSSLNLRRSYRMPRLHYWLPLTRITPPPPEPCVPPPSHNSGLLTLPHIPTASARAHVSLALSDP